MQKPYQNQKATVFRRYYSFVLSALCSIYLVSSLFCPLSTSAAVSTTTALDASKRIAGGGMHSIVLKANGEVIGWGRNQEGQCNIPPAAQSGVVAVSAGYAHSMALKADGTVIAWGSTAYNRCAVPADLNNAIAIAAGNMHSLALRSDGTIVGWGNTNAAALSNLPLGLDHVIAIASTNSHCLALKDDGTVVAWGENGDGQCNVPADLGPVVAIAAGSKHSLALKADGTVVAWGSNAHTQCDVPEGLSNVIAIAAGSEHSLALKADHSIIVWGATGAVRTVPVKAQNDVIGIAAGGDEFALALKNNGELIAWGYNYYHPCDVPAGLNMAGSLQNLAVNVGELQPAFDPNTLNYTLEAPFSIDTIELTAVLDDSVYQQLYINDELQTNGEPKSIPLDIGTTTVSILTNVTLEGVAEPGGLTRHYNLGIHRAGPDNTNANLWSITSDTGVLAPAFDPAITARPRPSIAVIRNIPRSFCTLSTRQPPAISCRWKTP